MPLEPGSSLGPYTVTAKLGEGGMGEVYRARDQRLNRDVALKVLPELFANDAERLARFEREAQTLASLNHPNVAHVHGLEESGGARALVMELVEGEDLSLVIARGRLPVAEALPIARQIAEAIEAAHELGIVHRDLKPANVMLTPDGKVKVLDFGLAKAIESATTSGGRDAAKSPTITSLGTVAGVIIGTAAYMSPEQARGKPVDKRADIWGFGCLLFEMLTGERAFKGEDASDVLAAVLRQEIDWNLLPASTPPRIRELLRRCLAKDVKQRLQAIGEARIALEHAVDAEAPGALASGAPAAGRPGATRRSAWPWAIAALALVGWVATGVALSRRSPDGSSAWRTSVVLPDPLGIPTLNSLSTIALSPLGDQVAFVGYNDGERSLYLRRLGSFDAVPLSNTQGANSPFFSPDGKRLGFIAGDRVWRIDLPGGVPVDLGASKADPTGGSWGDDDRIVYTPGKGDALWTIPAAGGEARALTTVDRAAGEVSHRWPRALPGGAGVLFVIKSATDESFDDARIAIADPKTGAHRVIIQGGTTPCYVDGGHLVYARAGRLFSVGFDPKSGTVHGAPVPVLDGVVTGPLNGAAFYDVTPSGLLAYVPGGRTESVSRFSWESPGRPATALDRLQVPSFQGGLNLSADFKRALVGVAGANDKIWLVDLEQMNASRLTAGGGNDDSGVLSPDGRWLSFSSDREGSGNHFFRMPLDGSSPPTRLFEGTGHLTSISYRARLLGFSLDAGRDGGDAYVVEVAEDGLPVGKPRLVAGGPGDQVSAAASPDGALVAYQTIESGRSDVCVVRLDDSASKRCLTTGDGFNPLWSRDGGRLFYVTGFGPAARIVSMKLRSASELRFDDLQAVTAPNSPGEIVSYDVASDGTSVLVARIEDSLILHRDIRIWPGWGETLPAIR